MNPMAGSLVLQHFGNLWHSDREEHALGSSIAFKDTLDSSNGVLSTIVVISLTMSFQVLGEFAETQTAKWIARNSGQDLMAFRSSVRAVSSCKADFDDN
jgi:hypothetical protein